LTNPNTSPSGRGATLPRWLLHLRVVWISATVLLVVGLIVSYFVPTDPGHDRFYIFPNGDVFHQAAIYDLDASYFLREFSQYELVSPSTGKTIIRVPLVMLWRDNYLRRSLLTGRAEVHTASEGIYVTTLEVVVVGGNIESIDFSRPRRAEPTPPL